MPNPASSGTGYLSVASILQRMKEPEGWKYLDALDKNMAEYTKSGSKPCKDTASGERAIGISFEYVAMKMKKDGAPVEMILPKEGSGYEMEANALTKKGKSNAAAKEFLDWAITDEAMSLYSKYFAAVSVAGLAVAAGGVDAALGAAGADSALGAAGASTARTAVWQDEERLEMFFCRHCSDAAPPGGILAQCAS